MSDYAEMQLALRQMDIAVLVLAMNAFVIGVVMGAWIQRRIDMRHAP